MKRKCKKCKRILPLEDFSLNDKTHKWRRHKCKYCYNKEGRDFYFKNKERYLKRIEKYEKTHPWFKNFVAIKNRCEYFPNKNYYTKGIRCRITLKQIKQLWFRDKAYLMKRPSVSRKNHNKNYTFSNCKFEELSYHARKSALSQWKRWRQINLP